MQNLKVAANKRFMAMSVASSGRDVSKMENLNLDSMNSPNGQKFWIDK